MFLKLLDFVFAAAALRVFDVKLRACVHIAFFSGMKSSGCDFSFERKNTACASCLYDNSMLTAAGCMMDTDPLRFTLSLRSGHHRRRMWVMTSSTGDKNTVMYESGLSVDDYTRR